MNYAKTAIVAAVAAVTFNASAVDFGTINPGFYYNNTFEKDAGSGAFTDRFEFQIAVPQFSYGSVQNVSASSSFTYISNMTVKLYNSDNVLLDDLSDNPGSNPNTYFYGQGTYVPGSYYFEITGVTTGAQGGRYTLTANTAPVPEPETYAMLLAGLGVMGAIAARRKKAKQD